MLQLECPCDCHDVSPHRARDRAHVDPVERRHDAGGPHLAAGRCRTEPGSRDPRISPLSQARRDVRAGRADASVSGRPRLRRRRVDIRGCGESDGLLFDEYAKQEQDDGGEVIAWLAAQPRCSGVVGMMGISWGGFNGLQIAARRPPALKAIVTICSTDDRYADDVHYMGGTLLAADGLGWGSFLFSSMCLPP